jgi:uncharacterized membrane protein YciS (DUF1049 family)
MSFLIASIFLNCFFVMCLITLSMIMKERIEALKAYNKFTQRTCDVLNEVKTTSTINRAVKKAI